METERETMTESEWDAFVEMVLEEEKRINTLKISRAECVERKVRLVNIADKVKRALAQD